MADLTRDQIALWRSLLAPGPGSSDGVGFECRSCRGSLGIDFGNEPTTLCHDCAQDFVESMGVGLLDMADRLAATTEELDQRRAIFRACTGADATKAHCPVHGECTCEARDINDFFPSHDAACPLHGTARLHAVPPIEDHVGERIAAAEDL